MEDRVAKLYELAIRFDEGPICGSDDYRKAKDHQFELYDLMVSIYGEGIVAFLNNYTDGLYEEMECEAQHYFQEGYYAGKKDSDAS